MVNLKVDPRESGRDADWYVREYARLEGQIQEAERVIASWQMKESEEGYPGWDTMCLVEQGIEDQRRRVADAQSYFGYLEGKSESDHGYWQILEGLQDRLEDHEEYGIMLDGVEMPAAYSGPKVGKNRFSSRRKSGE